MNVNGKDFNRIAQSEQGRTTPMTLFTKTVETAIVTNVSKVLDISYSFSTTGNSLTLINQEITLLR